MRSWITPEFTTVVLSSLIAVIVAAGGTIVAWLRVQTRKFNEMAEANHELLAKNTDIARKIQLQTDGINKKMVAIAEVVAFTKGRIKGRKEGEGEEPYGELDRLEDEYGRVSDDDFAKVSQKNIEP